MGALLTRAVPAVFALCSAPSSCCRSMSCVGISFCCLLSVTFFFLSVKKPLQTGPVPPKQREKLPWGRFLYLLPSCKVFTEGCNCMQVSMGAFLCTHSKLSSASWLVLNPIISLTVETQLSAWLLGSGEEAVRAMELPLPHPPG